MNKKTKWLLLSPIILASASGLTSCHQTSDALILRVINSEDYIYLQDPTDPESLPDLINQFEDSDIVKDFLSNNYPQYSKVTVVYDTSDTNETLYSELQTGKSNYDLMNVSDYMAQKIVASQMAVPLYRNVGAKVEDTADYGMIDNYQNYASANIKQRLDQITAVQKIYDSNQGKVVNHPVQLKDYAVGYMWGTLGILFNPTYSAFANLGEEQVIEDMQDFGTLWDSRYKGTISIKNSMRDTYALGVMQTYRDDFEKYQSDYLDAVKAAETLSGEEKEAAIEAATSEYQEKFSKKFNSCSESEVNEVRETLEELKNNIFGLEVDSGKQDIITKKIGVNLAWSGDAVYSMDQGEDLEQVSEVVELCYSVPELGSNLWFDAWIMPKCDRSEAQYELAHLFLDFLSDPVNAAQNMDYTGYTSFIGGDSVLELVRDWYDCRTYEMYFEEEYSIYSVSSTNEVTEITYDDFLSSSHDSTRDNDLLYYYIPTGEEGEDFEVSLDDLLNEETGGIVPELDENDEPLTNESGEEIQKTYGKLSIVDGPDSDFEEVDLTYFFDGTLDEYVNPSDMLFYSDCYLPYTYIDENGDEQQNISVGRQFFCQYPSEETLLRCAVMEDYGENNQYVMKMWENFKSDSLPNWAIIVFIIILVIGIGFIALLIFNNSMKKSLRKKRIQNK
ncbi:MAG: hypothetical protein J6M95_03670 [Bacilli bacterium]|nr:hypothetical protein [Bacilli bacterium]